MSYLEDDPGESTLMHTFVIDVKESISTEVLEMLLRKAILEKDSSSIEELNLLVTDINGKMIY